MGNVSQSQQGEEDVMNFGVLSRSTPPSPTSAQNTNNKAPVQQLQPSILLEQDDILIYIFTFLTASELSTTSRCCQSFYNIVFSSGRSYLFQQLMLHLFPHEEKRVREEQKSPNWFEIYYSYARVMFDAKFSTMDSRSLCVFSDNNRVITTNDGDNVWESAIVDLPMEPGSIHRWKFIVEEWGTTSNTYNLVCGVSVQDKNSTDFNSNHDIVYLRDNNYGMGFNLGLWELRIGTEHKPFSDKLEPDFPNCTPFNVGLEFDYTDKSTPVLHIYYNDKFLTTVISTVHHIEPPKDLNATYYPTLSLCRKKRVRVTPWFNFPTKHQQQEQPVEEKQQVPSSDQQ